MEILRPINKDFDFNSARSSPMHLSAPSSPKRFGDYYVSAPTSPSHLSQFYRDFDDFLAVSGPPSPVPSEPGRGHLHSSVEGDFAFDVSDDFGNPFVSADELFDGGVIKPMQIPGAGVESGSRANRSTISRGKDFLVGALSPRHKRDSGVFRDRENTTSKDKRSPERDRGRQRVPGISSSSRRSARSLSPMRVSQYPWEEEEQQYLYPRQNKEQSSTFTKPTSSQQNTNSTSSKGSRKWRLKDFFLFRSASEGRASDKDPLRKHTAAATFRRYEEVKNNTSKNVENSSGNGSVSKRRGKLSPHELHYTANRAASEDLKKKTFLPYKQGIFGRAFTPNGFGFSKK